MLDRRELTSHVQQLAEHFATSCRAAPSSRQVRALVDELVLDLLASLRSAPLSEVAATVATLERRRRTNPVRLPAEPLSALGSNARRLAAAHTTPEDVRSEPPASKSRDPFDITMPGELLEPAHGDLRREEEPPPSSGRRARGTRTESGRSDDDDSAALRQNAKPAEARPPAVSLREGEQLVRASGAGVVIRRIRTA